jgi:choline dehydrogenase-like flavoprotein
MSPLSCDAPCCVCCRSTFLDPVAKLFVSSAAAANISRAADFNDPAGRAGAGYFHFNILHGVRQSAAATFLGPLLKKRRSLLNVSLHSEVRKVRLYVFYCTSNSQIRR